MKTKTDIFLASFQNASVNFFSIPEKTVTGLQISRKIFYKLMIIRKLTYKIKDFFNGYKPVTERLLVTVG